MSGLLATATGGSGGGVAAGATAGALGAGGAKSTITNALLAGLSIQGFVAAAADISLVGQSGLAGGTTVAGAALSLPVTGLVVTGGTGGGGLPAVSTAGTAGGALTVNGAFPPQVGGAGGAVTPTAGSNGSNGGQPIPGLRFFFGGTGGGSSGLGATTGASGGNGGAGGYGCGGGGAGGSFTGSPAATGGNGGHGLVIITAW